TQPNQQQFFRQTQTNRLQSLYPEYNIRQPTSLQTRTAPRLISSRPLLDNGQLTRQFSTDRQISSNTRSGSLSQSSLANMQLARIDPSGRIVPLSAAEREEFIRKGGKLVGQVLNRPNQNTDRRIQPPQQRTDLQPKPATARNIRVPVTQTFMGFNRPQSPGSDNFLPPPTDPRRVQVPSIQSQFGRDGRRFNGEGPVRDIGSSLRRQEEETWWRQQQQDLLARERLLQKKEEELEKAFIRQKELELLNSLRDKTPLSASEITPALPPKELPLLQPTLVESATPPPPDTTTSSTTAATTTTTPAPVQMTSPVYVAPADVVTLNTVPVHPVTPVAVVTSTIESTTEKAFKPIEILASLPNDTVVHADNTAKLNVTFLLGMSSIVSTEAPVAQDVTQSVFKVLTPDKVVTEYANVNINTVTPKDLIYSTDAKSLPVTDLKNITPGPATPGYDAKVNELIRQMAIDMLLSRIKQSQIQPSPAGFDSQLAAELIRLLGGNANLTLTPTSQILNPMSATTTSATTRDTTVGVAQPPVVPEATVTQGASVIQEAPVVPEPSPSKILTSTVPSAVLPEVAPTSAPVSRPALNNFSKQLASLAQNVIEALLQQSFSGMKTHDEPLVRAANVLLGEIKMLTGPQASQITNSSTSLAENVLSIAGAGKVLAEPVAAETTRSLLPETSAANISDQSNQNPLMTEAYNVTLGSMFTDYLNVTYDATNATEPSTTATPVTEPTEAVPTPPANLPPAFEPLPGMENVSKSQLDRILSTSGIQSSAASVNTKMALVLLLSKYYGISADAALAIINMMAVVKKDSALEAKAGELDALKLPVAMPDASVSGLASTTASAINSAVDGGPIETSSGNTEQIKQTNDGTTAPSQFLKQAVNESASVLNTSITHDLTLSKAVNKSPSLISLSEVTTLASSVSSPNDVTTVSTSATSKASSTEALPKFPTTTSTAAPLFSKDLIVLSSPPLLLTESFSMPTTSTALLSHASTRASNSLNVTPSTGVTSTTSANILPSKAPTAVTSTTASYDNTSYDSTPYDSTPYDSTSYDSTSYDSTSYDTTSSTTVKVVNPSFSFLMSSLSKLASELAARKAATEESTTSQYTDPSLLANAPNLVLKAYEVIAGVFNITPAELHGIVASRVMRSTTSAPVVSTTTTTAVPAETPETPEPPEPGEVMPFELMALGLSASNWNIRPKSAMQKELMNFLGYSV
ncbi:mucin-5AC, partial [Biomphalaria glabrata]